MKPHYSLIVHSVLCVRKEGTKIKIIKLLNEEIKRSNKRSTATVSEINSPYPTAFPYGNGMVLHFYQQQESSTTKTVHKVINKGLKAYV